ncbi:TIGR03943 family putative permease subunit [Paenibacillus sp. CAU 1782]
MIHHFIRAGILIGFAMLIVYLFQTGEISLYIAPRMEFIIKLSALGLYIAGSYQVYEGLRKKRQHKTEMECDCGHDHTPSPSIAKNTVIYGLFIFPILLGFLMPSGTLGSSLAAKKGVSFSGSESIVRKETAPAATLPAADQTTDISQASSLDALFPADEYTTEHAEYGKRLYEQDLITVPEEQFIETLTTLDLYREALMGKEVELSGFVYREEEMGSDRLAVSRFAMNCCSADALPYGMMINWPKAKEYHKDEWIKVRGKLTTSHYIGIEIMTLDVTRIERIEAPSSPYVYPDLNFGF